MSSILHPRLRATASNLRHKIMDGKGATHDTLGEADERRKRETVAVSRDPTSEILRYIGLLRGLWTKCFLIWIWSHIATHLVAVLLVLVLLLLVELPECSESLRLRRFKSDRDELCQGYSWIKYASIDGDGFWTWRHTFKMAAMTLFHAAKCCHLAIGCTASARQPPSVPDL